MKGGKTMHIYEKDGKEYPSVTTILSMIEYNEGLMAWANIMGFRRKSLKELQNHYLNFGTLVHSHLQNIVDENFDEPIITRDPFDAYDLGVSIDNFTNLLKDVSYETIYTEKKIINEEDDYAGTLDWYVKFDGIPTLVDFKTSKRPYQIYLLQLGGYARLLEYNGDGYPDQAGILIANAKGSSIHPISGKELRQYTEIFLDLNRFYQKYHQSPFTYDYTFDLFHRG